MISIETYLQKDDGVRPAIIYIDEFNKHDSTEEQGEALYYALVRHLPKETLNKLKEKLNSTNI